MPQRYDKRIPTSIRVKVRGTDRNGHSFEQTASTINVSRTGARLDGIACLEGAQKVEVRRGWFRKSQFRVIWAGAPGTPEAGHVGLRQLEQDAAFWGVSFPATQIVNDYVAPAAASSQPARGALPPNWSAPAVQPLPAPASPASLPYMNRALQQDTDVVDLTWQKPASPTSRTIRERVASVTVRWSDASGATREESCPIARVMRDKSCIVPLKIALREGTEVTIINTRTQVSRPASVSMCGPQMPDSTYSIAIDLPAPDTAFWGSGNVH